MKKVSKKIDSPTNIDANRLIGTIVEAMHEKKAQNVVSLDLTKLENPIASYFVICNADSTTQTAAIAEHVEVFVQQQLGKRVYGRDGYQNAIWIILDYAEVLVHVFQTEHREFYKLEDLWADAELTSYSDDDKMAASAKR